MTTPAPDPAHPVLGPLPWLEDARRRFELRRQGAVADDVFDGSMTDMLLEELWRARVNLASHLGRRYWPEDLCSHDLQNVMRSMVSDYERDARTLLPDILDRVHHAFLNAELQQLDTADPVGHMAGVTEEAQRVQSLMRELAAELEQLRIYVAHLYGPIRNCQHFDLPDRES